MAVNIINSPGYLVREVELIVELYIALYVAEKIYGPYTYFLAGPKAGYFIQKIGAVYIVRIFQLVDQGGSDMISQIEGQKACLPDRGFLYARQKQGAGRFEAYGVIGFQGHYNFLEFSFPGHCFQGRKAGIVKGRKQVLGFHDVFHGQVHGGFC